MINYGQTWFFYYFVYDNELHVYDMGSNGDVVFIPSFFISMTISFFAYY